MSEEAKTITIEQALWNIKILADSFVGKKQEHIAIEQSINVIEKALKVEKEVE